jgi:energy-coupling factor transport system ATP-binding protein
MVFQYPEYHSLRRPWKRTFLWAEEHGDCRRRKSANAALEALTLVGLPPERFCEKNRPLKLSGGEKRRAALAGILAMRPKYLVLDEPMAGLDPRGRAEILALIESLREKNGTGIVMVSLTPWTT